MALKDYRTNSRPMPWPRTSPASERKLATERDILRKAAKYFAGETNW
ncbi:hypothetical protein [Streptomyces sp. NPDC051561]